MVEAEIRGVGDGEPSMVEVGTLANLLALPCRFYALITIKK
jgi:hypothetical protein